MTKEQLYTEIRAIIPVKPADSSNFRGHLTSVLKDFLSHVDNLDQAEKDNIPNWEDLRKNIGKTCDNLKEIINQYYRGQHSTAFTKLKNLISSLNAHSFVAIDSNSDFYKGRIYENLSEASVESIFHIPFTKIGIVKTQRYSAPGYPCLYLSKSIYGCWEELHRPLLGHFMVSRFQTQNEFKVLDLRIPTKEDFVANLERNLNMLPLIICVQFEVRKLEDTFKPEYILSQLITELIINQFPNTKVDKVYGIYYTSVHKSEDFEFPEVVFDCMAIPVKNTLVKGAKYCNILTDTFKLTKPTCEEYERIKGWIIDGGHLNPTPEQIYESSTFGILERKLKELPLNEVSPK